MRTVQLTAAALSDIESAASWFEGKREGLGVAFTDRVLEAIDRIEAHAEGYAVVFNNIRRVQLEQFKEWSLWFQIRADNSLVIACLSGKRSLELIRERSEGINPKPAP